VYRVKGVYIEHAFACVMTEQF